MQQKLVKIGAAVVIVLAALTDARVIRNIDGELLAENYVQDVKRTDVFSSRGWGAGGMPFNVLYTQNPKVLKPLRPPVAIAVPEPQPLRAARQDPLPYKYPRRPYSVIPHLFVSYGWGPVGKK